MSDRLHTHYDNLKVARNAPPEVIRAAYKILAQKYHPDRNPGDAAAARAMKFINAAYEVLSDPDRRREHDEWIAANEADMARQSQAGKKDAHPHFPQGQTGGRPARAATSSRRRDSGEKPRGRAVTWGLIIAVLIGIYYLAMPTKKGPARVPYSSADPVQAESAPPAYAPPLLAPNGQPWPAAAGYVRDYPILSNRGLSTVTIDNTQSGTAIFGKLNHLAGSGWTSVRHFYIPAGQQFTLANVDAGHYDVRYMSLDTGSLSRTESFYLQEIPGYQSTQYNTLTMTIYKVRNGNMRTATISPAEF